jgi:hypothetical protein
VISGWRAWAIVHTDTGVHLASPVQGTIWPHAGLHAVCSCEHRQIMQCEGQCGIRVWKDRAHACREAEHARASIIGRAQPMGRVSSYEKAWLASFCRVLELDETTLRGADPEVIGLLEPYLPAE